MSPDEVHYFTGAVWAVQGFNISQWTVENTSTFVRTPTGSRNYVCAINAVLQSMRNQYPDSPYNQISAHNLLNMFDNLVGRIAYNDEEDFELAQLVNHWTGGEYQVVVVSMADQHGIARRGGQLDQHPYQHLPGRNLYVHHQVNPTGQGGGHWESMRKKRSDEL
jgi:hypothetical protein